MSSPSTRPDFCQSSMILSFGATIRVFVLPASAKRLTMPSPVNVLPVPVPFVKSMP